MPNKHWNQVKSNDEHSFTVPRRVEVTASLNQSFARAATDVQPGRPSVRSQALVKELDGIER
jgi:hypothetical protein